MIYGLVLHLPFQLYDDKNVLNFVMIKKIGLFTLGTGILFNNSLLLETVENIYPVDIRWLYSTP